MKSRGSFKCLCLAAASAGALVAATDAVRAADAPQAARSSSGLTEIIVTAEKRKENLQKAPAAISVLTGETLTLRSVTDLRAVQNLIPSAKFAQEGENTQVLIRGIGSFYDTSNITPLVGFAVDGVTVPREATAGALFDLSQIEVLPGPQGTLYGRGSAGGIINVIANRPTDQFQSIGKLEAGNYATLHGTLVENVPFSSKFQLRAAVDYDRHDGYQTTGSDSADNTGVRISGLWTPTDRLSVYMWGSYFSRNGLGNAVTYPYLHGSPWNDTGANGLPTNTPDGGKGELNAKIALLGGQIDYRLDNATITFIPSIGSTGSRENVDEGTNGNFAFRHVTVQQYSGELRVASNAGSKLKWVGGLSWYRLNYNYLFTFDNFLAYDTPRSNEEGYVAYGQATYPILNWLRVTGGGRYQIVQKSAIGYDASVANFTQPGTEFSFDHWWHPFDYKVGLEADLSESSMAYATVQTGWNAGTYNTFPSTPTQSNYVEPSKLTSFTVGIKNRFLDNRLQLNDEAYYYNYKDFLVQAVNGATGLTAFLAMNKAVIFGDAVDVKYRVTENDTFNLTVGYNHARAKDFQVGSVSYSGYQLNQAPDITTNIGLQHVWNFPSGASILARVDSHYENGDWITFDHENATHQGAFTKTGLSLTYYSADSRWNAGLWAENLENTATFATGAGVGPGQSLMIIEPPRTFGIRLSYRFSGPT